MGGRGSRREREGEGKAGKEERGRKRGGDVLRGEDRGGTGMAAPKRSQRGPGSWQWFSTCGSLSLLGVEGPVT